MDICRQLSEFYRISKQTGKDAIQLLSKTVSKTDTTDHLCKIIISSSDLASQISNNQSFALLKNNVKELTEILGVVSLISNCRDWLCPERSGVEGKEKPFWLNPGVSNARITKNVFLTFGKICGTLNFFCAGKIPFLFQFKMGSILVSGGIGLYECKNKWCQVGEKDREIKEKIRRLTQRFLMHDSKEHKVEHKLNKWKIKQIQNRKEQDRVIFSAASEAFKITAISLILVVSSFGVQSVPINISLSVLGIIGSSMAIHASCSLAKQQEITG